MTKITVEAALKTLAELVAERGENFTYTPPMGTDAAWGEYTDDTTKPPVVPVYSYSTPDGDGSCIVGCVIQRLDPDLFQKLHEKEWQDGLWHQTGSVYSMVDVIGATDLGTPGPDRRYDKLTDAGKVLRYAQSEQDSGNTWGHALFVASQAALNLEVKR